NRGSLFLPIPGFPVLHAEPGNDDAAVHEVGHYHLKTHFGKAIPYKLFEELFGDYHKFYYGPWYFKDKWFDDYEPDPQYASTYAQVHPIEDYCETFVLAIAEIESGRTRYYGNAVLNRKVRAVKRWILKTAA